MKDATPEASTEAEQALLAVMKQFDQWRATRHNGERIPEALWQAATSLYPRYSVHQITKALRLDFIDIRDRVHPERKGSFAGSRPRRRHNESEPQQQFLPLSVAPSGGLADCHIRLNDGRRMKAEIHLKGAAVGPLVELLQALWRRATPS